MHKIIVLLSKSVQMLKVREIKICMKLEKRKKTTTADIISSLNVASTLLFSH